MPAEVWTTLQWWALTLLLYPGLLFAILVALLAEWATSIVWSLLRRTPRPQARPRPFIYPIYTLVKLSGRRGPAVWPSPGGTTNSPASPSQFVRTTLALLCVVGPVLALTLMPFPGSPLADVAPTGDLLTIVLLLMIQPLARAASRLQAAGMASLRGAQDIGKLLTGLVPMLIALAALVEVSGSRTLQLTSLTAAPETAAQTLVRLAAGAVLLVALPWWLDWNGSSAPADEGAGLYAGGFLQTVALAAFWAIIVLPTPGQRLWAIALYVLGTLLAYAAMRSYRRISPARLEKDAASWTWAASLPAASVALVVAVLWPGA